MPKILKKSAKYIVLFAVIGVLCINRELTLTALGKVAAFSAYTNILSADFGRQTTVIDKTETSVSSNSDKDENTAKDKTAEPKTADKTDSTVAETATKGKVLGKIIKKDLSNSGANTSYKNIYFNNCTGVKINIKDFINSRIGFSPKKGSDPQVLIYHTHATECFMSDDRDYYTEKDDTRSTDKTKNMVAVGNVLADELKKAGYSVVHDSTLHDHPSYTGSYNLSAETIKKYLKKYPSIKIIIDLHRDSIGTEKQKTAPVTKIDGKNAAQVMLVMGSNTGYIDNYPKWKENLKLATRLQQCFNTKYPGLSRALLLRSSLYNQNLSTGAMLIEVGTEANTLDEAKYSAKLVGNCLSEVMKGL